MMTSTERSEMAIPWWSGEIVFCAVVYTILGAGTLAALLNLCFRLHMVLACVWLAIMALLIWGTCKNQGGFRMCLVNFFGFFSHRQFVESVPRETGSVEIRFGYRLFGRRLFYLTVALGKIESVNWSPGQNPSLWNVFIWFDHDDPQKSLTNQSCGRKKPGQDIYQVGPSRRRKKTEAFGMALVDFLRRAGAAMIQEENNCTFVRAPSA
jgi:hypothetical protein